jgi:WD repeat-containing protein 48
MTAGVVNPEQEDLYEILCNDVVLPLDMTLAAVHQFVWKQAATLILHYRKRIVTPTTTGRG